MEKSFLEQIEKFYSGQIKSNEEILVCQTPEILKEIGAEDLPIIIKQSTLRKCTRKKSGSKSAHDLPRRVIEQLPQDIKDPVFIVKETERQSLTLIVDSKDRNGFSNLIAVKLNSSLYGREINEIKSIYGKEHLKEYIEKKWADVLIANKEKAKKISPSIGLQLSKPPINLDTNIIQQKDEKVKSSAEQKSDIARDLRRNGFQPTKSLIRHMIRLNAICQKKCGMAEIKKMYDTLQELPEEQRSLVRQIAQECRIQEQQRIQFPGE